MKIKWSNHAHRQRMEIIRHILREQTPEIANRWNQEFRNAVSLLPSFPKIGNEISEECFWSLPPNYERLRQTLCGPYRIIYEHIIDEIHILAIMDTAMLIRSRDTYWN